MKKRRGEKENNEYRTEITHFVHEKS